MSLLKDRILIAAIFISISWHALSLFLFNPMFSTVNIREHRTSISFLGDILESVIPENEQPFMPNNVSMERRIDKIEPSEAGFMHSSGTISSADLLAARSSEGLPDMETNDMLSIYPKESGALTWTGSINAQSEKQDFSYSLDNRDLLKSSAYHKKETTRVNFSDFFIKGDAKDRIIMHKPILDKAVTLPSDFNSDFNVNIKFKISKEGFIKYAECVTSSGFSEIDQQAIRYVRKWQFVPASEDDQEGVVRVSFK